ncbi:integrator complex subunit 14 [Tetranychus urticae]|nr:integrator complex subunit 14 [Tetranychus urticae]
MPTIILLDVSLSMSKTVVLQDTNEVQSLKNLAVQGLNLLLDYISNNCRLELISLMLYSSLWERSLSFTRDYDNIRAALNLSDEVFDKTNTINALRGVQELVHEEWGSNVPCNILLVTDGSPGISSYSEAENFEKCLFKFNFPAKLHIVSLCSPSEPFAQHAVSYFKKILETVMPESKNDISNHLWMPETMSMNCIKKIFQDLAESNYTPYRGRLHCGSLSGPIMLFPTLEGYVQNNDFEIINIQPSSDITICGFMNINEVSSPPVHSRHLIFSTPLTKDELQRFHSILTFKDSANFDLNASTTFDMEEALNSILTDESKQPSLCVLLHGALKVEGMVAICKLAPNWYGMIYSWADSKKKSSLMFSTFNAGTDCVSWLGNLSMLGLPQLSVKGAVQEPSKSNERKSYSSSCVVWIKQSNLQSDIQKVLRLAKKLPEKTPNFYKELNRFRKAALVTGFYEIIDGMAAILERECTLLPGGSNPEAALQLTHASQALRANKEPSSYDSVITPMKTRFTSN